MNKRDKLREYDDDTDLPVEDDIEGLGCLDTYVKYIGIAYSTMSNI